MADDLNIINKRRVYSDGTDTNSAATPVPVTAQQDLSTASALPGTNAASIVQPPAAAPAQTLGSASPIANPSRGVYTDNTNTPALAPVAAPAAQAAAAAPVTPTGGASQIPGVPAPGSLPPNNGSSGIPNWGGLPVGSQALADNLNYYGGKTLDSIEHNAPAFIGPAGEALSGVIQGVRGVTNVVKAVPRTVDAAIAESRMAPGSQAVANPGYATKQATNLAQYDATYMGPKPQVPGSPPPGQVPNTSVPGMTVTEGAPPANMAGTGTPISAAEQQAQATATAQRLGRTPAEGGTSPAPKGTTKPTGYTSATGSASNPAQPAPGPTGTPGVVPAPGVAPAENLAAAAPGKQSWWNASSKAQKAIAAGAVLGDIGIPMYEMGAADAPLPPVPGAPDTGTPGSMTGGDPMAGTPYAHAATSFAQPATSAIGRGAPAADANLGAITRTGNSYSGGPNIAGGVTINGQQPGGQSVGLGGTSPTPEEAAAAHARNMQGYANESQAIADKTARTLAQDEWNGPTPGMAAMDLSRTGGDDYKKFTEEANLNTAKQATGWSARGGTTVNAPALKAATDVMENRAKREAENLRAGNDLAKTRLSTQAENARSAATNAITARGQDLTAQSARNTSLASIYGTDSKSASEKAKLDYTIKKDDKEYQRTLAKDGREKADADLKARIDAQDEMVKRVQSMRDPSDKAGAARDAQAVMTHYNETMSQLEAAAKADPSNKEVSDQLDLFKRRGLQNYDPATVQRLVLGNQLTEKVNEANKKDPSYLMQLFRGTQTGVVSNVPFAGVKKIERPGAPDVYVETDSSGNPLGRDRKPLKPGSSDYGRVIPASVVEKNEGVMGTGILAKPSNDFRTLVH